jgi:hypothetical protein
MLAAYSFGIAGWIIGAAGTIRYLRRCGSTPSVVVFCAAGWSAGALVAVLLGQAWLADWRLGYWGPIVSAALGGSVGGAFTLHVESESAVSQRLQSALRWGASFLFFQAVAFYVGYILLQMTIDPLVPIVGHVTAGVVGWAVPAGFGGFFAARLALSHPQPNEAV